MTRNLAQGDTCTFCDGEVRLVGPVHTLTPAEAGRYFFEFEGMLVANAECRECEAQYLAWVDARALGGSMLGHIGRAPTPERPFADLSFRSTFGDVPGQEDLPKWQVEKRVTWVRVGPWKGEP